MRKQLFVSIMMLVLLGASLVALAQDSPQFEIGSEATVSAELQFLLMHQEPDADSPAVEAVLGGSVVTIIDGPATVGADVWWQIQSPSGGEGWVPIFLDGIQTLIGDDSTSSSSADSATPTPSATAMPTAQTGFTESNAANNTLEIGDTVTIGGEALVVTIHAEPDADSSILEAVVSGLQLEILDDAVEVDGVLWWNVRSLSGNEGWIPSVVDGQTVFSGPSVTTRSGIEIVIGESVTVIVTDFLLVYTEPSSEADVLEAVTSGIDVIVLDGPVETDGENWWQIETVVGTNGWVLEAIDGVDTLYPAGSTPPATPTPSLTPTLPPTATPQPTATPTATEVPNISRPLPDCVITARSTVNKRNGPGTNFDSPGQLTSGTSITGLLQTEGTDGFTWWQLDDESWVRSDVVGNSLDCFRLPRPGEEDRTFFPPTDRTRAPQGAVLLTGGISRTNGQRIGDGELRVEYYCNSQGYGVTNDNNNWYCTSGGRNVLTLTAEDFDIMCQHTYSNFYAFAIQNGQGAIPAFRWQCYEIR